MKGTKKFKGIFPAIGVIIIVTMLIFSGFWEVYGREKLLYKKVVVFRSNQLRGAVVTDEMLDIVSKPANDVFKAAITTKEQILGKGVNHFVPAEATLHPSFFDDARLIGDKNSIVFKVPNDWILSVPDSIRRGDASIFYEVDISALKNNATLNSTILNGSTGSSQLNTVTQDQVSSIKSVLGKDVLKTVIDYVKDTNNKEVINASNRDRYDGTSKISSIEILCTQDDVKSLEASYKSGHKFILLYSESGVK